MKLTPLEIKKQQFDKSLRGYDPTEVQSFLNLVSTEWEQMMARHKDLNAQVEKLSDKIKHYERVEEALHETLQTAKNSAEQKIEAARKEAASIREKARQEAQSMVQDANNEHLQVHEQILKLIEQREEMIRRIRGCLEHTAAALDDFDRQDAALFTASPLEDVFSHAESDGEPEPAEDTSAENMIPGTENIDNILDQID